MKQKPTLKLAEIIKALKNLFFCFTFCVYFSLSLEICFLLVFFFFSFIFLHFVLFSVFTFPLSLSIVGLFQFAFSHPLSMAFLVLRERNKLSTKCQHNLRQTQIDVDERQLPTPVAMPASFSGNKQPDNSNTHVCPTQNILFITN